MCGEAANRIGSAASILKVKSGVVMAVALIAAVYYEGVNELENRKSPPFEGGVPASLASSGAVKMIRCLRARFLNCSIESHD